MATRIFNSFHFEMRFFFNPLTTFSLSLIDFLKLEKFTRISLNQMETKSILSWSPVNISFIARACSPKKLYYYSSE